MSVPTEIDPPGQESCPYAACWLRFKKIEEDVRDMKDDAKTIGERVTNLRIHTAAQTLLLLVIIILVFPGFAKLVGIPLP